MLLDCLDDIINQYTLNIVSRDKTDSRTCVEVDNKAIFSTKIHFKLSSIIPVFLKIHISVH